MSRKDDIKFADAIAKSSHLAPLLRLGLMPDDADHLARVLPDAIAALRFVEEHGEALTSGLEDAIASERSEDPAAYFGAIEALRRLTAERGES